MLWDGSRGASDLMATQGGSRCPRCGTPHKRLLQRGLCRSCIDKDLTKRKADRGGTPEKLREDPDLAEVEAAMEEFQRKWDGA